MLSFGLLVFCAVCFRPLFGLLRLTAGFMLRTALIGLVLLAVTTGGNGVSMQRSFDNSVESLRSAAQHFDPQLLAEVSNGVYRWVSAELHMASWGDCAPRGSSPQRQEKLDHSQHC
ncbi:MAG: hypothetical protein U0136_19615 [Bdellovibrionota bacterium]